MSINPQNQHWFHTSSGYSRPRGGRNPLLVTYCLIGLCVLVWFGQMVLPGFNSDVTLTTFSWLVQPWRLLTSAFAHSVSSFMHIIGNMLTLWMLGRVLEPVLGRITYLACYLLSALGGSAFFVLFSAITQTNSAVVGASGAVFGLFGVMLAVSRHIGADQRGILTLVAINLAFGFILPGIAWQAHIGGFLTGLAAGFLIGNQRGKRRSGAVLLVLLIPIAVILFGARMLLLA